MYGMVNRAIEQFIKENHGQHTWERVASKAKVESDFTSRAKYPDNTSLNLVLALSEITFQMSNQILADVGEYWVDFAHKSEYGELLDRAGDTLPEVLSNLDEMYSRIDPSYADPSNIASKSMSFGVSDLTEDSLILHYASEQDGLAPLVVGLVRGLCKLVDTECSVIQVGFRGDTGDHDEFAVAFEKKAKIELFRRSSRVVN